MKKDITVFNKELFIKAVISANKEIYIYLNENLTFKDFQYSNQIGFGGDNSLNIDLITEKIFIKYLEEFGNIYSEECGLLSDKSEYTIIIDPLDGSNNFLSNLPYYGTSVALKRKDKVIAGFVTNLITSCITYRYLEDEIKYYSLEKNQYVKSLFFSKSKLAIFERAYNFPKICKVLKDNKIKYRSLGASALSLCDSRNYSFVLLKGNIREFDIAASIFICNDLNIYKSDEYVVISKNKEKFEQILEILKEI